jgi:hypothetical protein
MSTKNSQLNSNEKIERFHICSHGDSEKPTPKSIKKIPMKSDNQIS